MFETEKDNEKIIVLGKTFNSEEERRNYFRDELRKQLPELKKMEGFPIGEDEDILNLSDPPFYTACPNPWLNDFISEWEEDKKILEKEGKRSSGFVVDEPYASDVSVGKNNPIYTAHSYHTKVPHPAIMRYILKYTQPGDIVFDGFAGTGMTGVACGECSEPDLAIKSKIESEFRTHGHDSPNWGKRNAICADLSSFASFLSNSYNSPTDLIKFHDEAEKIFELVNSEASWMYETQHSDGNKGYLNYVVWSDLYECSNCSHELVYWDISANTEDATIREHVTCEKCGQKSRIKTLNRVFSTVYDDLTNSTRKKAKQVPVLKYYTCNGKKFLDKINDNDRKLLEKIANYKINLSIQLTELPDGYNTRQPKKSHGYDFVHDFYTKRNLLTLSYFKRSIKRTGNLRLLFLLTGMTVRSTKMNRIHLKNFVFGGGGWNAGHRKGTLYVPSISIETSPLVQIKDKIKSALKAFQLTKSFQSVSSTNSATYIPLKDNSIDFMYLDPPFGANINYSELNIFWESTLGVLTNNKKEAIQNSVQGKSLIDYQNLILASFKEFHRVIKPGKWIVVEFSNTKASVWNSISTAITNSGFVISSVSSLDKKQGGMASITSATAVKQDLVISCYKPSSEFDEKFMQNQQSNIGVWNFVEEHLNHLLIHLVKENATTAIIERSPKILFDRLIAFYVQKGLPVPIDAGKFQQGLRERFIERDGMFFTNEQVQEYDKKRAESPEFIQLSILVSSEQDGVLWLKNLLTDKSLTYQDIQPHWMQALAGVRKGDLIPELADILEENFLKDTEDKWYTPDPENEADLEKLRTKRLLKQFDTYKTEAAKPKAKKIKEVRVEALRAGFKQCYQDKDFQSIVAIGDKIPNNLLMEDEVLLQFYDIASTRL